jgi:hypothetical protein
VRCRGDRGKAVAAVARKSAGNAREAAGQLARNGETLSQKVETFLREIRAA